MLEKRLRERYYENTRLKIFKRFRKLNCKKKTRGLGEGVEKKNKQNK